MPEPHNAWPLAPRLETCLHVTAQDHLPRILRLGLEPRVGPLSQHLKDPPAVWMFPYWSCLEDAQWLWEAWPYACEPALLAVSTQGLGLRSDVDYEVASFTTLEPSRIQVLFETESGWSPEAFLALGGLLKAR